MKFEFTQDEEYYFHIYEDDIQYRRRLYQSQLDEANKRRKDEMSTLLIFGSITILILFFFLFGIFVGVTGGVAGGASGIFVGFIGSGLTLISMICLILVFPFTIYKTIHGYLLYCVCKSNLLGQWLIEHTDVPIITEEIDACRQYIAKCDFVLQKIDKLKDDFEFGVPVDFSEVEADVRGIKLLSDIPVQTVNTAKMKNLTKNISIVTVIVVYIIAFVAMKYMFSNAYSGLVDMFRQI